MKKSAGLLPAILFTLCFAPVAFAAKPPTLPNSYDGPAPSARSMAMGETGTAMIGSYESYYYNAANMAFNVGTAIDATVVISRQSDASPSKVALFEPSGQGLTSAIFLKDSGGIAWSALSDYTTTTTYLDDSKETAEVYINALTITAGQKNDMGFSIGLNMTYLYGKIGESYQNPLVNESYTNIASGNGFTFDLDFTFPAGHGIFFGLALKNIAGFMFWDDYNSEQLPFIVRAGLGYQVKGFSFTYDLDKRFYRFGDLKENYMHFGLEQYINNVFCLRGGVITDDDFDTDEIKYTYGLAMKVKRYELAFAAEQYKIDDEGFSKFLLSFTALVL